MTTKHTAETVRPARYPALEAEVYASLDCLLDRETLLPAAGEAADLVQESVR